MRTRPPAPAQNDAILHVGDALEILSSLPSMSVDSVITDPPYAIKRIPHARASRPPLGRPECDAANCQRTRPCSACDRAHQVAMYAGAPMLGQQSQNWHERETHSRGYADNDPQQFQRWCTLWLEECLRILKPGGHLVAFGGTRTWHRLASAAEDVGFEIRDSLAWLYTSGMPKSLSVERALSKASPASESAAWAGWGTALKPAFEPIVLGRRPLSGTMVHNVKTWGVGPLNLDAATTRPIAGSASDVGDEKTKGKWPSNVHLDTSQAAALRESKGQDPSSYFWVSKPNSRERVVVDGIAHPTVKPLDLLQHLVRLVTPPGGTILEPFAGSGTTVEAALLEGMRIVAIERDPAYLPLIKQRIARRVEPLQGVSSDDPDEIPRLF